MTLLAIDPGTTQSAYVILDADKRPVEFQKIRNGELLSRIELAHCSATRWTQIDAVAIEMPGVAMVSGGEIFHTCRWVGKFEHAWNRQQDVHGRMSELVYRKDVKLHLLGRLNQKGSDKLIRAALIAKYGGPTAIRKGGPLHRVAGDCWAALSVALTYLDAPRGVAPGQADAARKQMLTIWETGSGVAP